MNEELTKHMKDSETVVYKRRCQAEFLVHKVSQAAFSHDPASLAEMREQKAESLLNVELFGKVPSCEPAMKVVDYIFLTAVAAVERDPENVQKYSKLVRETIYSCAPKNLVDCLSSVTIFFQMLPSFQDQDRDLEVLESLVQTIKSDKKKFPDVENKEFFILTLQHPILTLL